MAILEGDQRLRRRLKMPYDDGFVVTNDRGGDGERQDITSTAQHGGDQRSAQHGAKSDLPNYT